MGRKHKKIYIEDCIGSIRATKHIKMEWSQRTRPERRWCQMRHVG